MGETGATSARPDLAGLDSPVALPLLAAARRRADGVGVRPDRVLAVGGVMSEDAYLRALARRQDLAFEPLDAVSRAACPLADAVLVHAVTGGFLPFFENGTLVVTVVPRALESRRLLALLRAAPDHLRLRLTSEERLRGFLARHAGAALADTAVNALARRHPSLSAARTRRCASNALATAALTSTAAGLAAPAAANLTAGTAFAAVFLGWAALRLFSVLAAPKQAKPPRRCPDAELPTYTIIAALHREERTVMRLVAALDALDYPREKLDILIVLEPDDLGTQRVVADMDLRAPYHVVIAPEGGPRTKPKALNTALPLARGTFIAVYDAEDEPEPDQLRGAVAVFATADARLACVQARLTIANTRDNWLTRVFTAEYAGLFDVFLPGLARFHLPLPLGGSSNHFDAAALREVGGWDPYNVTEDADLGLRLARFGYGATVMPSSTWEEAPPTLKLWLKQRTRWFKGWTQTWLVHIRTPWQLWRQLGTLGFLTFQLVVGGSVLAALVHPVFLAIFVAGLIAGGTPRLDALAGLYGAAFVSGYLASALLGVVGLARRKLLRQAWALLLIPLYWALLSIAAWRALVQLVRDPFHWEKTEHGLARTTRKKT